MNQNVTATDYAVKFERVLSEDMEYASEFPSAYSLEGRLRQQLRQELEEGGDVPLFFTLGAVETREEQDSYIVQGTFRYEGTWQQLRDDLQARYDECVTGNFNIEGVL